jgi:hypothetical protein
MQGRRMDPSEQLVIAVAGVSVTVILGALLAIARRDRRAAGGRTTARTIDAALAVPAEPLASAPASPPESAPQGPAPTIPAPQTPVPQVPVVGALAVSATAPRARRLRFGRRAGT